MKIWNIGRNAGSKLVFHSNEEAELIHRDIHQKYPIDADFYQFYDWEDFLILSREIKPDDNLVIVMSRKDCVSYHESMQKIPGYQNEYFTKNNFLLIYPFQDRESDEEGFEFRYPSTLEPLKEDIEKLSDLKKSIMRIFGKK